MTARHWLLKTEPETYSFAQLLKEKKTPWNGVRNFQARNFLREMRAGDLALIYHSGKERSVVGIAEILGAAYPESTPESTKDARDWLQVDVRAVEPLKEPVPLAVIKAEPSLQDLALVRQSRLSVMPLPAAAYRKILALGKSAR